MPSNVERHVEKRALPPFRLTGRLSRRKLVLGPVPTAVCRTPLFNSRIGLASQNCHKRDLS